MWITEAEMTYLIGISKGRVLECSFGVNRVRLAPACKWAVDELEAFYARHPELRAYRAGLDASAPGGT
jgi:hypothetical protein